MLSALACVHKCFTQIGHLKSAKSDLCEAASNTWLKHLLAVKKKYLCSSKNHQIST